MIPEVQVASMGGTQKNAQSAKVVDLRNAVNAPDIQTANKINHLESEKKFLEKLLFVEAKIRSIPSLQALKYFAVNELKTLLPAGQILLLRRKRTNQPMLIEMVSSLATVDQYSPTIRWLTGEFEKQCQMGSQRGGKRETADPVTENLQGHFRLDVGSAPNNNFSLSNALIVKLQNKDGVGFAALAFLAEQPFLSHHQSLAARLAETIEHAWLAFEKGKSASALTLPKPLKFVLPVLVILAMFIPVPLIVLSPVTLTAFEPKVVAAPLTGVVETIYVQPNSRVRRGDLLFSYQKTDANNVFEQARQNVIVAEARYARANQDAFGSGNGRRDMAVARAEWELAVSEQEAAERKLALADVRAQSDGIALFESTEKWTGRPVNTGERVMRIADPAQLEVRLDLPAKEAIIFAEMKQARIFLDGDPLHPWTADIKRVSYEAELSDANILVYPLFGKLQDDRPGYDLRIGARGTAQLSGQQVQLWFFLFRKPLSFLRQFTGI